ncbi:LysR family transcriptional regulator [Pseudoxanthomonas mexicana]|jgi:DNA-binding transcriptional LysR family regulator|uniref:LysR family transcriptional regulator n=1 Tax=Pseudoxanthomonas mexicana TaxID=128785 RepID=UPI001EE461EE|nr:LysR family transcriptional regulator [Pseudoxanthomonas mexicana]
MHINLHLLRIFFMVSDHRSFSRAAEVLHVSQPAVSKAVRELERQLDLTLIERGSGGARGTKGVRLTDSGSALYEHARGIFALERAALEDIRARIGNQRGRLVVGASTTVAGYWLPPYVAALSTGLPSIDVRVVVGNTQSIAQTLIDCELDVALVEGVVDDPRIVATHWRDDQMRLVAHPAYPVARRRKLGTDELNRQPWLMREPGSGTRLVTEDIMQTAGIEPDRRVELGSNEGIARAAAAGLGVAILPECVVRDLAQLGRLKYLRHPVSGQMRPLYLLQLRERPPSPLVRAFTAILAERHG